MDLKEGNELESKVKNFSCSFSKKIIVVMFSAHCNWKTPEAFDYTPKIFFRRKSSSGCMWKPGRRLLIEVLWMNRYFLDSHTSFALRLGSTCTAQHCPIVAQSDHRPFLELIWICSWRQWQSCGMIDLQLHLSGYSCQNNSFREFKRPFQTFNPNLFYQQL